MTVAQSGIDGTAQYYLDPFPSQIGHVFGQDTTGPASLVAGYLDRATGVDECLASSTWAALTGLDWPRRARAPGVGGGGVPIAGAALGAVTCRAG